MSATRGRSSLSLPPTSATSPSLPDKQGGGTFGSPLLITGAGRSGTWWMTKALRRCGVSASHEKHFSLKNHGPVPPGHAEVSWLAAPHTPLPIRTVHLVRDPLKVIASRAAWGSFEKRDVRRRYDPTRKGRYALKHVPQIAEARTPIERAAVFWVAWTGLVEADEVLKVEDATPQVVFELAVYVNPDAQWSEPPPPTVNSNKHTTPEELTWGDVAHIPGVMLRAEQLGYL